MATADKAILINNLVHSIFKNVRIHINESLLSGGDNKYCHNAFIVNQFQYRHVTKSTFKVSVNYNPEDTIGKEFTSWDHPTKEA